MFEIIIVSGIIVVSFNVEVDSLGKNTSCGSDGP
jgi:hypothetical protein